MGLIPIGNSTSIPISNASPINIPVSTVSAGSIILNSPTLLSNNGDSLWGSNNNILSPTSTTYNVVIGGTTLINSEKFRIVGTANINKIIFNSQTEYIDSSDGDLIFYDANSSLTGVTLTQLSEYFYNQIPASKIDYTDFNEYYGTGIVTLDSILDQLGVVSDNSHVHSNYDILETYTQTESDLADSVLKKHDAVTISQDAYTLDNPVESNGLFINDNQLLYLKLSNTSTTGSISSTDWNTFNDKQDQYDILDDLGNLTPENGVLYYYGDNSLKSLSPGVDGQILSITTSQNSRSPIWIDNSNNTLFAVPINYTSISNEIGDITNSNFTSITDLNNLTILEVLQKMLFPIADIPTFIVPTIDNTMSGITTTTGNNGRLYIEIGETFSWIQTDVSFNSNSDPDHSIIVPDSYYYNNDIIGNGTSLSTQSVTIPSNLTTVDFLIKSEYIENDAYVYTVEGLGDITPADFTGYPASTPRYTNNISIKTYPVDPFYYGVTTTNLTTGIDLDTLSLSNKRVLHYDGISNFQLTGISYSGALDADRHIYICMPTGYPDITRIDYNEAGFSNVRPTFSVATNVLKTRSDATTASYKVYYVLNSFNVSPSTVTYTIYI